MNMGKAKKTKPTKEDLFFRNHANKLAHSFRLMLEADSSDEEMIALGRIQALRSTTADIEKLSGKTLVTGIQVAIRSSRGE